MAQYSGLDGVADRIAAAQQLGDQVNGHPERVGAFLPSLSRLLAWEHDNSVLVALLEAAGHAWDERAAMLVLESVSLDHPDSRVREKLAAVLPNGVESARGKERVAGALAGLSGDPVAGVRDWACFGLFQLGVDSPVVREALAARLADDCVDIRCEALVTLARFADARARADLLARCPTLESPHRLEIQACAWLADPRLLPVLESLQQRWQGTWEPGEGDLAADLDRAIARCDPQSAVVAARFEAELATTLEGAANDGVQVTLRGEYPQTQVIAEWRGRPLGAAPVWGEMEPDCPTLIDVAAELRAWVDRLHEWSACTGDTTESVAPCGQ